MGWRVPLSQYLYSRCAFEREKKAQSSVGLLGKQDYMKLSQCCGKSGSVRSLMFFSNEIQYVQARSVTGLCMPDRAAQKLALYQTVMRH